MKKYWNGIVANCYVVRLRSTPSLEEDNIVGYSLPGTIYPILEKVEGFYKVQKDGEVYYIHENFIEESHRKLKNIKKKPSEGLCLINSGNFSFFLKKKGVYDHEYR